MTLYYLIQTYMQLNEPDKMQNAFLRFQDVLDEQYSQERAEKINEIEVKYQVDQKNKEIEFDVSRNFDFSANLTLNQAESQLMDEIIRSITDDIFNQIFSNW